MSTENPHQPRSSQRAAGRAMHRRARADALSGDLAERFPDGTRVVSNTTTSAQGVEVGTVVGRTRLKLRVRWDRSPGAPTQVYPIHVDRLTVKD